MKKVRWSSIISIILILFPKVGHWAERNNEKARPSSFTPITSCQASAQDFSRSAREKKHNSKATMNQALLQFISRNSDIGTKMLGSFNILATRRYNTPSLEFQSRVKGQLINSKRLESRIARCIGFYDLLSKSSCGAIKSICLNKNLCRKQHF